MKQAVTGLQQLVKQEPKKKDEIVRNFKRHMDFASVMSAPAPKPIQLPPDLAALDLAKSLFGSE